MKVYEKNNKDTKELSTLEVGDFFNYLGDNYFIISKSCTRLSDQRTIVSVFNLDLMKYQSYDLDTRVILKNGKIIVND